MIGITDAGIPCANLNHSIDDVVNGHEIQRCVSTSRDTQCQVNGSIGWILAPHSLERGPEPANECIDSVKMSDTSGSRISDHHAGPIHRWDNASAGTCLVDQFFRLAFGCFVRISKCLSDVDFGFQGYFSNSRDVSRADMVQPSAASSASQHRRRFALLRRSCGIFRRVLLPQTTMKRRNARSRRSF